MRRRHPRAVRFPCAALAALIWLAVGTAVAADFRDDVQIEEGGTLRIELDAGRDEIESHAEDVVRVTARASGPGSGGADFSLTSDGNEVRLTGAVGGLLGSVLDMADVRVTVRVPSEISVDVQTGGGAIDVEELEGDVRLRTSGGDVQIEDVEGDVDLETSGGHVKASRVQGRIRARTSGGRIRIRDVEGDVEARTSGGSILVRDVAGRVDAHTSGGEVVVRFLEEPEGRLETSGGRIEVTFPAGSGADVDAETSGGRVEFERGLAFRGEREAGRVRGEIGEGGGELSLRTSGGNIRLRPR